MSKEYKFYNRIAKEYGMYDTQHSNTLKEYPGENSEEVFKRLILSFGGKDKVALDLGCGDGKFTLSIANNFRKVHGIDLSEGLLNAAKEILSNEAKEKKNIHFDLQDAENTLFPDNSFDLIYSRRGPIPYKEIWRLLKLEGTFLGIEISELDCKDLKMVFGRGQNYGQWNEKHLERDIREFKELGFKVIFEQDYFFTEYYPNYNDLDQFLKRVPIFEDFNSQKDEEKLSQYANDNNTSKGIKLLRHKSIIVVRKAS